jgi:Tfp pilus assembly protein PilX
MLKQIRQRGVSLITAIFLLVGMSALGLMMTRMLVTQSVQTTDEWLSAQALYAAESGVQYAAYQLNRSTPAACSLTTTDLEVTGQSWFSIRAKTHDTLAACEITATGKAGGTPAHPKVQRQLVVIYRWAGM